MYRKLLFAACAVGACAVSGCQPDKQAEVTAPLEAASGVQMQSTPPERFVPEVLPPHLDYRVAATQAALMPAGAGQPLRNVISRLKVWPPELQALRVCFFRGKPELRARIANVAKRWLDHPVGIALDFGAAPSYRDCLPTGDDHIRIGFQYAGYWSLVGQDSYREANQMEQSMNFEGFLVRTPAEPEFTRVVLHEFGHAFGFEHEHQHPWSKCADEFKWEVINAELSGPPNFWSQDVIDFNMKEQSAEDKILTQFDVKSIMLYAFPERYYKNGKSSACYAENNDALSAGDEALFGSVYALNRQEQAAALAVNVTQYVEALRSQALDAGRNVKALQALTKFTGGRLPKDAVKGVPMSQLPKELRDAQPLQ